MSPQSVIERQSAAVFISVINAFNMDAYLLAAHIDEIFSGGWLVIYSKWNLGINSRTT